MRADFDTAVSQQVLPAKKKLEKNLRQLEQTKYDLFDQKKQFELKIISSFNLIRDQMDQLQSMALYNLHAKFEEVKMDYKNFEGSIKDIQNQISQILDVQTEMLSSSNSFQVVFDTIDSVTIRDNMIRNLNKSLSLNSQSSKAFDAKKTSFG